MYAYTIWLLNIYAYHFLQLYFKIKPPEANKPQAAPAPVANGTAPPGVPPQPLRPPPQAPPPLLLQAPPPTAPPAAVMNPPRPPPPAMVGSQPPPPPPVANGPPGLIPPPIGGSAMANFTRGLEAPRPPSQGFPGQQMQGQASRPPQPQPNMGH
ncbi:hypothetical protein B296_00058356 [Ensete ventricosum]|uniref:Uncharacterized protein n=1 Tax=Ensete ventricosum TaxID=4639 RepID=A0A426X3Y9_ENSVE|nr:hypothetical protein B296_00058356 [Ensete ventricosum]